MREYDRRDHFLGTHCWCRPIIRDIGVAVLITHRRIDPSTLASRYEQIRDSDESNGQATSWNNDFGWMDDD